jgi:THO complex subunit 1
LLERQLSLRAAATATATVTTFEKPTDLLIGLLSVPKSNLLQSARMITHKHGRQRQFTDVDYIDSIEDPFFKSVAQQVVSVVRVDNTDGALQNNNIGDVEKAASAIVSKKLEDLEIAIRRKLLELLLLLQENGNRNCDDHNNADTKNAADVIGVFWKSSLDLCHHLVHHAFSSSPSKSSSTSSYENLMPCRRLPYVLLSDCLEGLPSLEDAKCFWIDYVEPELIGSVLFGDKFWSQLTETNNSKKLSFPSSHLPFLKVANQFLKRLEHASDNGVRVEWKGRIMWALSKGFSIADKSSLKSWGNFHATNGTDFESKEEFNKYTTVDIGRTASINNTIEYNLYEAFWSLQNDFSNPNKLNVGDFIKRLRLILAAMESATATSSEYGDENSGIDKQTIKYLTSSALLPSQIQDPAFRSSVVTQFLIIASHLGAESPPLKNALASLLGRACKLLKNDNPQLHDILWESILVNGREDHWRTWKKQKCAASTFAPNFKRNQQLVLDSAAPIDDDHDDDRMKIQQKRRRLAKDDENGIIQKEIVSSLSHNVLDKNDLIAVSKDLQKKLPTLEEHLEPYVEALDPESGIEDEYHPKNDSLFTWRAMRLYAKHQLPLMSQCRRPADLEKITREWYRQSHGKDIPGEIPALKESDNNDDNKKKDDTGSADDDLCDDRNDDNKNDTIDMDTEMKDSKMQEEAEKEGTHEKNDEDMVHTNAADEDKANVEMENISNISSSVKKLDEDQPKLDDADASKRENEEIESVNAKKENYGSTKESFVEAESSVDSKAKKANSGSTKESIVNTESCVDSKAKKENSGPTKESIVNTESGVDSKATKSKTDGDDERRLKAKNIEVSKSKTAVGTTTDNRNNDKELNFDKDRNSKNDNHRQEKHLPRENISPQNRVSGRRGNDGGRNNQERGGRNDGPPSRGRSDDNHQPRGGVRSSVDSSYRGRSDGQPVRGGRYDEDYRGDSNRHHSDVRGERFTGERSDRPTGRDNHRGGDRGGGIGREDHRGGERGGDRRNTDTRPRGGGGGSSRRGRR